jgi:hypothetical protein
MKDADGSRWTRGMAVVLAGGVLAAAAVTGTAALGNNGDSGSTDPAAPTYTDPTNQGAPVNTTDAQYDGVLEVGATVTADPGTWDNRPTSVSYQWFSCDPIGFSCPNIPGATSPDYVIQPSDAGNAIGVEIIATNGVGQSPPADSLVFGPVPPPVAQNATAPSALGTPQVGQTLTTDDGTWTNSPTDFSYQWYSCDTDGSADSCEPIPSANDATYTVTSDDIGHSVVAAVSATNDGGVSDEVQSQPSVVTG